MSDELWEMADADLVALGAKELAHLGLVKGDVVQTGYVVRMPKAYPVYDEHYKRNVDVLRTWLAAAVPNVHPVGRNGMHRYNNQDHSMFTALLTAKNILGANPPHDVWDVNVEEDYHEEQRTVLPSTARGTGRDAPIIPRDAKERAA